MTGCVPLYQRHLGFLYATGDAVGVIVPVQDPFNVQPMAALADSGEKFSPALQ
jgi:hypothetical protein